MLLLLGLVETQERGSQDFMPWPQPRLPKGRNIPCNVQLGHWALWHSGKGPGAGHTDRGEENRGGYLLRHPLGEGEGEKEVTSMSLGSDTFTCLFLQKKKKKNHRKAILDPEEDGFLWGE